VFTYNGYDANVYVNGDLNSTTSASSGISSVDSNMYIGLSEGASTNGTYFQGIQEYFSGKIDEVMLFNRALSTDEITQLYHGTAYDGNVMDSSLIGDGEEWIVGYSYSTDGTTWSTDVNSEAVTITD
jgi:hypothetical protein